MSVSERTLEKSYASAIVGASTVEKEVMARLKVSADFRFFSKYANAGIP
jgi:hypothetical protein